MIDCVITLRDELAHKVFLAEDKEFKSQRASYEVNQDGELCTITIKAQDPTALRAAVTSVTRILNIVEKTR